MIHDSGVPMMCCGQKMEALEPNTVEASGEKHLPVVAVEDGAINVNVGAVNHPMAPEHFIEWVYVQTENGGQRKALKPGDAPNVSFCLGDDKAVAVYAYFRHPRSVDDGSITGKFRRLSGIPAGDFS